MVSPLADTMAFLFLRYFSRQTLGNMMRPCASTLLTSTSNFNHQKLSNFGRIKVFWWLRLEVFQCLKKRDCAGVWELMLSLDRLSACSCGYVVTES